VLPNINVRIGEKMQIDAETRENIQNFIKSLTNEDSKKIHDFLSEILDDKEFHEAIAKRGDDGQAKKPFSLRVLAMDTTSCLSLYVLCRVTKPAIFVECGVASGMSSSYILRALNRNKFGKLYSIDVPWHTVTHNWKAAPAEDLVPRPQEKISGWLIPDNLRDRWDLTVGRSSDKLPALLKQLGPIDIFFHDSEHTYDNMVWEFTTVWPALKPGGRLLAHNVDKHSAFADFEQKVGGVSFKLAGRNNDNILVVTGGKIKPS